MDPDPIESSFILAELDLNQSAFSPTMSKLNQFAIHLAYAVFFWARLFLAASFFADVLQYPVMPELHFLSTISLATVFFATRNISIKATETGKRLLAIFIVHELFSFAWLLGRILKLRGQREQGFEMLKHVSLVVLLCDLLCILCGAEVLRQNFIP